MDYYYIDRVFFFFLEDPDFFFVGAFFLGPASTFGASGFASILNPGFAITFAIVLKFFQRY